MVAKAKFAGPKDMWFVDPKGLREAYDKAVRERQYKFEFEGREYLTKFAFYLLQYLEGPARV